LSGGVTVRRLRRALCPALVREVGSSLGEHSEQKTTGSLVGPLPPSRGDRLIPLCARERADYSPTLVTPFERWSVR